MKPAPSMPMAISFTIPILPAARRLHMRSMLVGGLAPLGLGEEPHGEDHEGAEAQCKPAVQLLADPALIDVHADGDDGHEDRERELDTAWHGAIIACRGLPFH